MAKSGGFGGSKNVTQGTQRVSGPAGKAMGTKGSGSAGGGKNATSAGTTGVGSGKSGRNGGVKDS